MFPTPKLANKELQAFLNFLNLVPGDSAGQGDCGKKIGHHSRGLEKKERCKFLPIGTSSETSAVRVKSPIQFDIDDNSGAQ